VRRGGHPVVVVAVCVLLLGGCGGGGAGSAGSSAAAQSFISGPGVVDQVPPAERWPSPRVQGPRVGGGRIDSAEYRGKIVVYNVWGSWCPPCRAEAPSLRRIAGETKTSGVQFVGINIRDNQAAAQAFERRFTIPYPSVFDPEGRLLLLFRGTLPPNAIPSTIVVDRQGRAAARIVGGATYEKLRAVVDGVLAEDK
jgi:thiol-disulfide isomerase/thioredoxin